MIANALVLVGLVILTLGVFGTLRLPDVYTQLHAASKAGYIGVIALLGAAAVDGDGATIARAVLIALLLSVTTPVAAHAIARAARERGEPLETPGAIDEARD